MVDIEKKIRKEIKKELGVKTKDIIIEKHGSYYYISAGILTNGIYSLNGEKIVDLKGTKSIDIINDHNFMVFNILPHNSCQHFKIESNITTGPVFNLLHKVIDTKETYIGKIDDQEFVYNINSCQITSWPYSMISAFIEINNKIINLAKTLNRLQVVINVFSKDKKHSTSLVGLTDLSGKLVSPLVDENTLEEYSTTDMTSNEFFGLLKEVEASLNDNSHIITDLKEKEKIRKEIVLDLLAKDPLLVTDKIKKDIRDNLQERLLESEYYPIEIEKLAGYFYVTARILVKREAKWVQLTGHAIYDTDGAIIIGSDDKTDVQMIDDYNFYTKNCKENNSDHYHLENHRLKKGLEFDFMVGIDDTERALFYRCGNVILYNMSTLQELSFPFTSISKNIIVNGQDYNLYEIKKLFQASVIIYSSDKMHSATLTGFINLNGMLVTSLFNEDTLEEYPTEEMNIYDFHQLLKNIQADLNQQEVKPSKKEILLNVLLNNSKKGELYGNKN